MGPPTVMAADERHLPKVLADWNKLDDAGRVILSAKRGPQFDRFDYGRLEGRRVLLIDPPEAVVAIIERDAAGRWVGAAEWGTQFELDARETAAVAEFGADFDERPFPGIWINPARAGGAACLDGTGISVKRILKRLSANPSVDATAAVYELDPAQVRAAIAYAAWIIDGGDMHELVRWRESFDEQIR